MLVRLVQGMPSSIAISFLRGLPLAAVDRPASRQGTKVAQGGLLVMVHAGASLSIVTLRLHRILVAGLPSAIVSVMAAVFPWQAAVKVLRRVHGPAAGFLVSRIANDADAVRLQRRGRILALALRATAQMFPQPFAQTSAAVTVPSLLDHRVVAVLASETSETSSKHQKRYNYWNQEGHFPW